MTPNRLYTLCPCLLILCASALCGQSVRSEAKEVRPFYTDSNYDRFTDEYHIVLKSRPMIASNRKISWQLLAMCDRNGICVDPVLRMQFSSIDGSKEATKLFEALADSDVTIDVLYHTAIGDERDQLEFNGAERRVGRHVGGIFVAPTAHARKLRQALSIEARISNLVDGGPSFTIPADQVMRLKAFWQEFDRRFDVGSQ